MKQVRPGNVLLSAVLRSMLFTSTTGLRGYKNPVDKLYLSVMFQQEFAKDCMCSNHFSSSCFNNFIQFNAGLKKLSHKQGLVPTRVSQSRMGGRAFSYQAPLLWNMLPVNVQDADTLSNFKIRLKAFLFDKAYS